MVEVKTDFLRGIISAISGSDPDSELKDVSNLLNAADLSYGAVLMTISPIAWDCVSDWSDSDLEPLIRFFTVAEMQLPGWAGGNKSPVIALVKLLKKRETFTPELRRWIKANTDNRYLPHGSAL